MASFNVTSSQTLATFLAANPTLTNGDTIIFSGAWTITQNADVALTDLIIDSTGQAGKWVDGTATTYSRTRWSFKAGTSACLTTTAGKTTAGPLSGTGGSVSGAYGVVNYGTITTSTGTGGSVSGAHGVVNNGFCGRGTLTSTVSGAYAVRNTGMLEMDPSICSSTSGPAVFCTVASVVRLPDGASTALIGGVYTVQYWPLASDIVVGKPASGTPALGSVGTGPTRGFLRKMMDG